MRKALFVSLALLMVMALVSCNHYYGDDVDRSLTEERLVGTWYQDNGGEDDSYYYFNEDGTCENKIFDENGDEETDCTMTGTWTLANDLATAVLEYIIKDPEDEDSLKTYTYYFKYADPYLYCLEEYDDEEDYLYYDSTSDKYRYVAED